MGKQWKQWLFFLAPISLQMLTAAMKLKETTPWKKRYDQLQFSSVQSLSRVQLCDPMDFSMPGLPVHHQLPELFSSSSRSAIRVVSSADLRLLIFLLAILIPACASSSPACLMMYSACKLNKQGNNIQPWCTPFPIWNQSVVQCPVLTVASWPAYWFLKRQVR